MIVYGKLRVYVRGFSEGKSDEVNLQRPLVKPKIEQLFLYFVIYFCDKYEFRHNLSAQKWSQKLSFKPNS